MPIDQRKEERYDVPDPCRQDITLTVKKGSELAPAVIGNFSRHGILFESPLQFNQGDRAECVLRIDFVLAREITFGIEAKYCYGNKSSFIVGASIHAISEDAWFDAFEEIFDFVVIQRRKQGGSGG